MSKKIKERHVVFLCNRYTASEAEMMREYYAKQGWDMVIGIQPPRTAWDFPHKQGKTIGDLFGTPYEPCQGMTFAEWTVLADAAQAQCRGLSASEAKPVYARLSAQLYWGVPTKRATYAQRYSMMRVMHDQHDDMLLRYDFRDKRFYTVLKRTRLHIDKHLKGVAGLSLHDEMVSSLKHREFLARKDYERYSEELKAWLEEEQFQKTSSWWIAERNNEKTPSINEAMASWIKKQ